MIEIESLYKYYGTSRAVGPLSTTIATGEVVGLLGLNGAGKTTTLRILTCDLLPSSGTVRVDGVDVVDHPDRVRAMIGYLPDTPPLYEEMSVRRYLEFAARLRRSPEKKVTPRVNRALASTGLEDVADKAISALSHGYRQRVGIAQAIVHEPKLVVLDEPSSGLDPMQIREMRKLVRGLAEEHTVLVSSHNLPEISEMCDRLLVMGDGEVIASGTEEELVAQWLSTNRFELDLELPDGQDAAQIAGWLNELPLVEAAEVVAEEAAVAHFKLQLKDQDRAGLITAIVENGLGVVAFKRTERDLENVFARLAANRNKEPAA